MLVMVAAMPAAVTLLACVVGDAVSTVLASEECTISHASTRLETHCVVCGGPVRFGGFVAALALLFRLLLGSPLPFVCRRGLLYPPGRLELVAPRGQSIAALERARATRATDRLLEQSRHFKPSHADYFGPQLSWPWPVLPPRVQSGANFPVRQSSSAEFSTGPRARAGGR